MAMLSWALVAVLAAVLCVCSQAHVQPHKTVVWSNVKEGKGEFVTRTVTENEFAVELKTRASGAELVVVMHDVNPTISQAPETADVFKFVYPDHKDLLLTASLPSVHAEVQGAAQTETASLLSNGAADVIHVKMTNTADIAAVKTLMESETPILFVAVESQTAASPARSLQSSSQPVPEGGQYSIYKDGDYLYMTPDLFTGLMTGLFVTFVLFTGFSCMNEVQGMNNFYDKLPAVGKEA